MTKTELLKQIIAELYDAADDFKTFGDEAVGQGLEEAADYIEVNYLNGDLENE